MSRLDSTTPAGLHVESLESRLVPAMLDLTSAGAYGMIEGARFEQYDARPTGTGKIDSFLRIQGASSRAAEQQGFNTSARPLQFNENKSPNFTRDLKVSELPLVNVGGYNYREFLLDVNQRSSQPYLSLDELKVFVTDATTKAAGFDVNAGTLGGAAPVYDMDPTGADNWVKLDYRLNSGSGSGDMLFYVRDDLFAGGEYVTVYSKFGERFASNAGFQEWAVGVSGSPNGPQLGAITGTVFFDRNRDGDQDEGEQGLNGATVFIDADKDGLFNPETELSYATGDDGHYQFEQLKATVGDDYFRIGVIGQANWEGPTGATEYLIYLAPGELSDDNDFGFYWEEDTNES